MYKDIYLVYCYDKEPLLDPGGGASTFGLLFCSFLTNFGKNAYILVVVMSFNVEISYTLNKTIAGCTASQTVLFFFGGRFQKER